MLNCGNLRGLRDLLQNLGKQGWNGGGQYNPSELSGWGGNLSSAYPGSNLDTSALLAAQVLPSMSHRLQPLFASQIASCTSEALQDLLSPGHESN